MYAAPGPGRVADVEGIEAGFQSPDALPYNPLSLFGRLRNNRRNEDVNPLSDPLLIESNLNVLSRGPTEQHMREQFHHNIFYTE